MGNNVEIRVTSKNQAKPGLADASRDLGEFAKTGVAAGDAVAASMQRMADKVVAAQTRLSKAGDAQADQWDRVRLAQAAVTRLTQQDVVDTAKLEAAKARLDSALRKMAQANDAVTVSSTRAQRAQSDLAAAWDRAGRDAGADAGGRFSSAAAAGIAAGGPVLTAAAGAAMAAAGSAAVAGLGAALGGAGLVFAKNDSVTAGIATLRENVTAELRSMARPFEQTWATILDQGQRTFDAFTPALTKGMQVIAPAMSRFSASVGAALRSLEPAVEPVARAFSSILDDIGPRLPRIFGGIEQSLSRLSGELERNPEAIGEILVAGGKLAELLLNIAAAGVKASAAAREFADVATFGLFRDEATGVAGSAEEAAAAQLRLAFSAEEVAAAEEAAAEAAREQAERLEDLVSVTDNVVEAQLRMRGALRTEKEALGDYNEAVRDHGRASDEAKEALLRLEESAYRAAQAARDNALAQQAATGQTRDQVGANIAARDALQAMAGAMNGPARDAILRQVGDLNNLIMKLRSVSGDFYARVHVSTSGQAPRFALGAMQSFAHGGVVGAAGGGPRSRRTLVGEQGPEIVDLAPGSTVHPAGESRRMLETPQAASPTQITVEFRGDTDSIFAAAFMKLVRTGQIQIQ